MIFAPCNYINVTEGCITDEKQNKDYFYGNAFYATILYNDEVFD